MGKVDDRRFAKALSPLSVSLAMMKEPITSDIVHCHTWYTFMAGFLAKQLYGQPLVTTIHSLEPYVRGRKSSLGTLIDSVAGWSGQAWKLDMVIAVSEEMKKDILKCYDITEEKVRVVHNGIDLDEYRYVESDTAKHEYGIWDDYILFVGRMSRQKGIFHLLDAVRNLPEDVQVVVCAGAPDTEEVERELVQEAAKWPNVKLIRKMVPKNKIIELYSHAQVFCCPSIYEPFGIINLEAMACETPVVASSVGGITEVVVDEETGFLVEPGNSQGLAEALNKLLSDRDLACAMGKAGRQRVEQHFSWDSIARQTLDVYEALIHPDVLGRPDNLRTPRFLQSL